MYFKCPKCHHNTSQEETDIYPVEIVCENCKFTLIVSATEKHSHKFEYILLHINAYSAGNNFKTIELLRDLLQDEGIITGKEPWEVRLVNPQYSVYLHSILYSFHDAERDYKETIFYDFPRIIITAHLVTNVIRRKFSRREFSLFDCPTQANLNLMAHLCSVYLENIRNTFENDIFSI